LKNPIANATVFLALLCAAHAASAQTPTPTFETASVRPAPPSADPNQGSWSPPGLGRFNATHAPLALLIQLAYGIDNSQIANKPAWLETNLYDVTAKPEEGIKLTREELKPRLQALLKERFHLVAHTEMRDTRGYALIVSPNASKTGLKLTPTKADHFPGFRINVNPGHMEGANWTAAILARMLTSAAGFPVVDQTGLTGSYDIAFTYEPNPDADSTLPTLSDALKKATGLELKPQKVSVETIVIDSVDTVPTGN
jgi:uncharacterized protein (TIGR03435 family)